MSDKTFYLTVGLLFATIFTFSPSDYHKILAAILVAVLLIGYLKGSK